MSAQQEQDEHGQDKHEQDKQGWDKLDTDIGEAFGEVFGQMVGHLETVARRFELPPFCVKALHMLSAPMAMKELGQRFHCDPSFVTAIADLLDSHGLGCREPDSRDRRIKHLKLTPKGLELRERIERELVDRMPWSQALDNSERECLLGLLRKMIANTPQTATGGHRDGEAVA